MTSTERLESRIEPIEYLARSPSRLKVLQSIHRDARTRDELKEVTEISRVTLSRVLANFEEREWIERKNGDYEVTSEGAFVATEVSKLLGNMQTLEHLDGAMKWLPVEAFDFDLSQLRDAEVSTSDWGDHTAQIRAVADTIYGSERIVATASGVSRDVVDTLWEVTVNGEASIEAMVDDSALDTVLGDKELRRQHREMLATGNVEFLRYEGDEDPLLMLTVCDDTVIMCGHDPNGPPPGTLETTDPTVRDWAMDYFETIRTESTPMGTQWFRD